MTGMSERCQSQNISNQMAADIVLPNPPRTPRGAGSDLRACIKSTLQGQIRDCSSTTIS